MFTAFQPLIVFILLFIATSNCLLADTGVDSQKKEKSFKVFATIEKGCLLGSGSADTSHFGTINFGDISSLNTNIDTVSAKNAGSIIVKCTPNTSVTIAIDSGAHTTSISGGRYLLNNKTNETLRYQLYQDSNYGVIWGNGGNGGVKKVITATGQVEELAVYARLYASNTMPSQGVYTDTVVVTISY